MAYEGLIKGLEPKGLADGHRDLVIWQESRKVMAQKVLRKKIEGLVALFFNKNTGKVYFGSALLIKKWGHGNIIWKLGSGI